MSAAIAQLKALPDAASSERVTTSPILSLGGSYVVSLAKLVAEHALQPIVEIGTGQVYGYEALMRGFDRLGVASPTDLLDHAAECGDLVRLETVLFDRAIAKFVRAPNFAGKKLFLNLDGRALNSAEELMAVMSRSAKEHGLALSNICIELSERYNNAAVPRFSQISNHLRGLGVRMAIDDFGVGSSELKMLCDHSVDYVKIDGHFVRGISENRRKRLVVTAIANLAHVLGIRVVAEGVETELDLLGCREAGCDLVQGYFVARPTTNIAALPEAYVNISTASRQTK